MQHKTKTERGFTLIELLIVVAIIGLLASTILVGLGTFRQSGRDARRVVDLRQIQTGLEIYFQKCGRYPGGVNCAVSVPADFNELIEAITKSGLEIRQIPNDPLAGNTYYYGLYTKPDEDQYKKYILGAILEDANNPQLRQDLDNEDLNGLVDYEGSIRSVPPPHVGCGARANDTVYCIEL